MDMFERMMSRARALQRAWKRGANSQSLWRFENWAHEEKEAHHIAREKFGSATISVPISMHRELTRRQMEEHPPGGTDPTTPLERRGRYALGLGDILDCLSDALREIGEKLIMEGKNEARDLDGLPELPPELASVMQLVSGRLLEIAMSRTFDPKDN